MSTAAVHSALSQVTKSGGPGSLFQVGIISWFKGKAEQVRNEQYLRANPVREDHYAFVHFRLRQFAQQSPETVWTQFDSKTPEKFLKDVWTLMPPGGGAFVATNPEIGPEMIRIHSAEVEPYLAKIVEMPVAKAPGEAELVAIVWRVLPPKGPKLPPTTFAPTVLYYTLEFPAAESGLPQLCMWEGEEHKVLGTLPNESREGLEAAVVEQVRVFESLAGNGATLKATKPG